MNVKSVTLTGFRNFSEEKADFSDGVNVIFGDNAQGKTNLLEAVWFLAAGKSFRDRSDSAAVGFDSPGFSIKADIYAGGRDQTIEITLPRGGRKTMKANGVRLRSASGLSERLTAVLFYPEDLFLIRGGAAARRRMMDACISQLRPRYAEALSRFNRAYESKLRILRDSREKPSLLSALDDFSEELARCGSQLIYYRAHFIKRLASYARDIHREFSGGREELSIAYATVKTVEDPLARPEEILPALLEHQRTHREAEIAAGACLSGAHKDDMTVFIDGREAKSFASQGQTRTASLSLKLAEREIHFSERGEYPLLLLDDVLSELDSGRRSFVLNRIKGGQIFITCCESGEITERMGGRLIRVENGRIVQA
ncbi:MAG: DNA replication/repair protein RecF [Oscillospiraceae bacterium]|nr:DNA replication/repair protein RecF [Oscillospiraceae bacterium]